MQQTPHIDSVLNTDVLINVMSFSGPRTISRLMRTSRELYTEGPKYLLRHTVKLTREPNVPSFVAFMRVNDPKRCQLLKRLEISTGRLSEAEADGLEKFLLDFGPLLKITRLTIDRAEELFESSRGLSGVFSLISSVKHLTVSEIGRRANTFLINSRSSLKSANLFMIPQPFDDDSAASSDSDSSDNSSDSEDDDDDDFRNPIVQLHASQATLETLSVCFCDTFSDAGPAHVYPHVYPRVHTLTLAASEVPAPAHYARAFPAVRVLTLECDPRELEALGADFADLRALRALNAIRLAGAWAGVQEVHGTLMDHFLLGLGAPVERVHVSGPFMDKRMWRLMLLDCRPAYVNFQGFDVDLFFDGEFKRLMRGHFLEPVRCFEIMVFFGGMLEPDSVDAPEALNALIDGIGKMPSLRSFGLTLCCYGLQPGLEDILFNHDRPRNELCAAEEYPRELDLDAFALRIQKRVPRLETISISLIGHRARPSAFATLGADVAYAEGAVERIPLRHGSRIDVFNQFDPAKILRNMSLL